MRYIYGSCDILQSKPLLGTWSLWYFHIHVVWDQAQHYLQDSMTSRFGQIDCKK
jgi:hypothetical protein